MADNQPNAYQFQDIYEELRISFNRLGCIMLDIDPKGLPPFKNVQNLYDNSNNSIASGEPHVTLLYGLMQPGTVWKKYVDEVLEGWSCTEVTVDHVDFFDSPNPGIEPYYCIVAHVKVTPQLQEGHDRLQLLPHIDTFPGYKAHITVAYVNRDDKVRDDTIAYYQEELAGKSFKVKGLNYGTYPGEEKVDKSMYCVSCRDKKEPVNLRPHKMKNGRDAQRGECPDCGTGMFRIGAA